MNGEAPTDYALCRRNSTIPSTTKPTATSSRSHTPGTPATNALNANATNASPMQMYHHPNSRTRLSSPEDHAR